MFVPVIDAVFDELSKFGFPGLNLLRIADERKADVDPALVYFYVPRDRLFPIEDCVFWALGGNLGADVEEF